VPDNDIAVVMPTYNRGAYIGEALDSLLRQTRPPAEVIVVDDRSTDDTRMRVEGHPFAARIRYHLQPENRGASIARNVGVEMARSGLIVFLDSDDILETEHHAQVTEAFDARPEVALFCCDSSMIGSHGESIAAHTWTTTQCEIKRYRIDSGPRSLEQVFLFSTPFPGMAVRRSSYQAVGGLDQGLFPLDDYDLQLKVAGAGLGVYFDHRALARYRIHGSNESGASQAIRVGKQKLRCIELALARYPSLRDLGRRARGRRGEARRELAIALLQQGLLKDGIAELLRSLQDDPGGVRDLAGISVRRLRRTRRSR
jgi:glycosyltransferase involved in cell wall biosynthesis